MRFGSWLGTVAPYRLALAGLVIAWAGCAREHTPGPWKLAFTDTATGRVAVCRLDGSHLKYLTPDSIWAEHTCADSTGTLLFFAGTRPEHRGGPGALYRVRSDGRELERLLPVPFHVEGLAPGPTGDFLIFTGHYLDQPRSRAYRYELGGDGFAGVTPGQRAACDPAMVPTGANFFYHNGGPGDTMWVGTVTGGIPIPIMSFPYTQCSFAPNGLSLVAVGRGPRNTLDLYSFKAREARPLVAAHDSVARVSDPAFHPQSERAAFVVQRADEEPPRLAVIDLNSLQINELELPGTVPARPAWVR